ncbi:MAG: PKD domain-containing protein, partial [Lentimicrobium sp.]|nr:PKD domain-containing protein [Lentimicrobium sp.]
WEQKTFNLDAYNGQTIYVGIQCVSDNAFIFMVDDFNFTTTTTQTNNLTGQVTDAFNGNPIPGATVTIAGLSTTTDNSGNYTINNIPAGTLNAEFNANVTQGEAPLNVIFSDQSSEGAHTVTCSKTGYITYSNNQVIIEPGQTLNLNISLSQTLAEGSLRFVLNWGQLPYDLDSHLNTPSIEGTPYHIFYGSQGSATAAPYAALDHDDTDSYGPETMTIYQMFDGTYQYYIHNYSTTPDITTSQAVLQIYNDNGLMQTLQVPTSGTGLYWYVCDVNGANGQLTIRNVIQQTPPGAFRDPLPEKKANKDPLISKNITSWQWNFGDGGTSTQQNPTHTYTLAGTYTVSLTVSDGSISNTETKTSYITVTGGSTGNSTLTGMVTDAFNGNPIPGATVTIAGLSAITDSQGNYTIVNVPAGTLNAEFNANVTQGEAPLNVVFSDQSSEGAHTVTCSKTGYITYSNNQVIIEPGQTLNLNISLSQTLAEGSLRFVLNWGQLPYDLDSHLNTPSIEGTPYHIFYGSQGSATSAPYAALDHDDTDSYGPETMTIYQLFDGTYQYYIHNYSTSPDITTSQAVLQIYNDNGLLQTLQVPTSGTGLYWYVCDVNGANGQLTIRNVIQEAAPGTFRDPMPVKPINKGPLNPKNITSWQWNFGDGGTSTQQNPSHTYTTAGTYTVSLTVGDGSIFNTETKTAYITVTGGSTGNATLTGQVTDAVNGNPIAGALVSVAGLSATTDSQGNYTINNIPLGALVANFNASLTSGAAPLVVTFTDRSTENANTVTCSQTGYITYSNNQVIIPDGGSLILNISLSPTLAAGNMRFVLNWGIAPEDLDSHLNTPVIEGQAYHVFYENEGSANVAPFALLDFDDTDSYGPETMTIYQMYNGTYQYYIHNYTESPSITTSQAVVQIYNQTGLLYTLQVPASGTGLYWYVCDVNGATGQVTIRNVIQEAVPGTFRDKLPAKVLPEPVEVERTITSWSWDFGDGSTSTLQNPSHTFGSNGSYTISLTVSNGSAQDTETKTAYIQVGPQGTGDNNLSQQLNLYPVPASTEMQIESPEKIGLLIVTDMTGTEVFRVSVDDYKYKLNVENLMNGIYFIKVETVKGSAVKKFAVK